jgi:hypothetical protein
VIAGPTVLTLPCGLLHGVSVRLVECAPRPVVTPRANAVHARGFRSARLAGGARYAAGSVVTGAADR